MSSIRSKVYFIVLTALLVGGFPNFMAQEAHAAAIITITPATATTTTITVTWSENVDVKTGETVADGDWTISTGQTVTSITHTNGTTTSTLNLGSALATDATPNVTYAESGTANSIISTDDGFDSPELIASLSTDGIVPVLSSVATTSSTTIVLEMSESVTNDSAVIGDFTIGGVSSNPTVDSFSGFPGRSITLTLSAEIIASDSPTVTYTQNGRVIDDGGTGNQLAAFTDQKVTNSIAGVKNGGGCDDCEAPTLGIDSESKRIVDNGFIYNGKSTDAERFFTPYPLITATVGKQNTAVFKIYEDKGPENIKHFSFAYGLDKGELIGESKAIIELDIDYEGTETVTVTDPENVLDNIKVSTNIANCNDNNFDTQCLIVTIDHMFRAPLDFNIVGTDVWDMQRNSWQNYFNHGIEVTGESLNPAKKYDGINAGHIYHLTEIGKNIALDEFGNSWSFQYGKWMKDFVQNERVQDTSSEFTRNHSDFAEYKKLQAKNAIPQLLELCPTCLDSFTDFEDSFGHEYSNEQNKLDNPEIIQKMILENDRAQKIMNYLLDPLMYYR